MAWVVDRRDRHAVYRLNARDPSPRQLPDPAPSVPGAFPRVVGFLTTGDLLIAVNDQDGRTLSFVRSSGRPADWDARSLSVATPPTGSTQQRSARIDVCSPPQ